MKQDKGVKTMSGKRKLPEFGTMLEWTWYEKTPKRVLFAIARDYAVQAIGEERGPRWPTTLVLRELQDRQRITKNARLDCGRKILSEES